MTMMIPHHNVAVAALCVLAATCVLAQDNSNTKFKSVVTYGSGNNAFVDAKHDGQKKDINFKGNAKKGQSANADFNNEQTNSNWKADTKIQGNNANANANTAGKSGNNFKANGEKGKGATLDKQSQTQLVGKTKTGKTANIQHNKNAKTADIVLPNDGNKKLKAQQDPNDADSWVATDDKGQQYRLDNAKTNSDRSVQGPKQEYKILNNGQEAEIRENTQINKNIDRLSGFGGGLFGSSGNIFGGGQSSNLLNRVGQASGKSYAVNAKDVGRNVQQSEVKVKGQPIYRSQTNKEENMARVVDPITGKATLLETTVDVGEETSCLPETINQAGKGKIEIIEDSIKLEVEPTKKANGETTYEWPSCVNFNARVRVPPNTDLENMALQMTMTYPGRRTATCCGRSSGNTCPYKCGPLDCFFKDICSKPTPSNQHKHIGNALLEQSSQGDTCSAYKGGTEVPVSGYVCPNDDGVADKTVLSRSGQCAYKGDMVIQMRAFDIQKDPPTCAANDNSLRRIDCRQVRIKYTIKVLGVSKQTLGSRIEDGASNCDVIGTDKVLANNVGPAPAPRPGPSPAPRPAPAPAPRPAPAPAPKPAPAPAPRPGPAPAPRPAPAQPTPAPRPAPTPAPTPARPVWGSFWNRPRPAPRPAPAPAAGNWWSTFGNRG